MTASAEPHFDRTVIALESRLSRCRNVVTLGVKPNFSDYSRSAAKRIMTSEKIYYPTPFYAELFDTMGKITFPSYHTYKCVQDKIKQNALFEMMQIPHPKTRIFYGKRQQAGIGEYFQFPFIAKIPRGSALGKGVFLIENREALRSYLNLTAVACIQEYLPSRRDIRVVIIGKRVVHAYWRVAADGEFRSNVAAGGVVSLENVPQAALDLALYTATACKWDDVGMDILPFDGGFFVLEANMKYGKEGFRKAGIDYYRLMEKLIDDGEI